MHPLIIILDWSESPCYDWTSVTAAGFGGGDIACSVCSGDSDHSGLIAPIGYLTMLFNLKPLSRRLRAASIALLAPLLIICSFLMSIQPAMAMGCDSLVSSITFAAMSNRMNAAAKDAEGKLESTYGDITGDKGHQLKGKAKQAQSSAMNVAEDVKEGARSAGKKIADASGRK